MGDFRVVVEAVGGHGCGRGSSQKQRVESSTPSSYGGPYGGYDVERCGGESCPDCITIRYVREMESHGANVSIARIEHWPVPGAAGTNRQANPGPIDDLKSGTRDRKF